MLQCRAFDEWYSCIAILHRSWCDADGENKPKSIDEHVPLAAPDLLPRVVPVASALSAPLHTLTINDPSSGLDVPTLLQPNLLDEGIISDLQGTVHRPFTMSVVHRLPRREVVRKHSPSASCSRTIANGIQDLAAGVFGLLEVRVGDRRRNKGLQDFPFRVRDIRGICLAGDARDFGHTLDRSWRSKRGKGIVRILCGTPS